MATINTTSNSQFTNDEDEVSWTYEEFPARPCIILRDSSDSEDIHTLQQGADFSLGFEENLPFESSYLDDHLSKMTKNQELVTEYARINNEEMNTDQKINEVFKEKVIPRRRKLARKRQEIISKSKSMVDLNQEFNDIVPLQRAMSNEGLTMSDLEIAEDALQRPETNNDFTGRRRSLKRWISDAQLWIKKKYDEMEDDFSEVNTVLETPTEDSEPQMNPFRLKKNLLRFGNIVDPLTDFIHECAAITRWENPSVSMLTFIIYMVIIYKDWIITVISLVVVSTCFFTYLRHRGWSFNNEDEKFTRLETLEFERDIGIRDQVALIMLVGRRSQNESGKVADILEKIRNLLLWREPELTKTFIMVSSCILLSSLLIPPYIMFKIAALAGGIHLFVIQYIFYRFPRLQRKYDKIDDFLKRLKTDADFERIMKRAKRDNKKYNSTPENLNIQENLNMSRTDLSDNAYLQSFHDIFRLPISETPIPKWKNGRRCILANKDRYFSYGFKVGKLYLTSNYVCFEKSRTDLSKNILIPLETIKYILKAKLYNWIPGGGKAIEIKPKGNEKAFVFVFQIQIFGPIINRDEAYESIVETGKKNGYAWANVN